MPDKHQPLVSILTPVYNNDRYIADCIESITAQTYENWEYTIVNNCSTDDTLKTALKYAEKDRRINIVNNDEFLDIIRNWNHALRQISPESTYCKVVHADDWLFPECIEKMVNVAQKSSAVSIVGAYRLDEDRVNLDGLPLTNGNIYPGREICRRALVDSLNVFGSPTSLLIRSDAIRARHNFYNEDNINADTEACFTTLQNTDFGFVHQVLSYTRRHDETNTSNIKKINTFISGSFHNLINFGPVYLNEEEYNKALGQKLNGYYLFLGQSIFKRKGKKFWDFHSRKLEDAGFPIKKGKLLKASATYLYNRFLDMLKI